MRKCDSNDRSLKIATMTEVQRGGPYDNMNMLKGDKNRRYATLVF